MLSSLNAVSTPIQPNSAKDTRHQFGVYFLVACIIALSWGLFAYHLDYESLWGDEGGTWRIVQLGPTGLVLDTAEDVHPPFYYLWVWGWVTLIGNQSVYVLRLSSVIPAVLTVAFVYLLGREWFHGFWGGLAAAVFLGTSGVFVYYARELRMYTLIAFLVVVNWWYLDQLFKGKRRGVIGYAVTLALMAYTYYFSAFVVVAQIVTALLFYRHRLRAMAVAFGIALVSFIPWIPVFFRQIVMDRARSSAIGGPIIGQFAATSPTTPTTILGFLNTYTAKEPSFIVMLILLALLLGLSKSNSIDQRRWLVASALWLFLTIFLFFAVNLVIPVYNPRYVLTVVPALALVIGRGVQKLPTQLLRTSSVALIFVSGVITHDQAFLPLKIPHGDMLKTVAQHYLPGDKIWYNLSDGALGSTMDVEIKYYLIEEIPQLKLDMFVWAAPNDFRDVRTVPRVWDIRPYWIQIPAVASPDLVTPRVISEEYPFGPYTVRLYEAPPLQQAPVNLGGQFDIIVSPLDKLLYHPGDTVVVKPWWRVQQTPALDYSYGLYLRKVDTDNFISQLNAGLTIDNRPTSQWLPSTTYTLTNLSFKLPNDLSAGDYQIWLGVYDWQNPARLLIQTSGDQLVDSKLSLVQVAQVTVK